MGKNLHHTILTFFNYRMDEHGRVTRWTDISDDDDYIFRLERTAVLPTLDVHLSDAYLYTKMEFYSKPACIGEGDFILVARPEAKMTDSIVTLARESRIGIGGIGKLMGALNKMRVWEYEPPEREQAVYARDRRRG